MKNEVVLSDRVEPCGSVGDLRNIYALGSFSPDKLYFIEVSTVEPEGNDDASKSVGGKMKLPVRSVGCRDRQYFFSADMRFISHPGIRCVFPAMRALTLSIETVAGRRVASLKLGEHTVYSGRARKTLAAAIEDLAQWAARQTDEAFEFPDEVVAAMKSLDDFSTASDLGDPVE